MQEVSPDAVRTTIIVLYSIENVYCYIKDKTNGEIMDIVKYVKANPNKNTTALVLNSYPRSRYVEIAMRLMCPESVYAEQVGFVEKPSDPQAYSRLHMMGGEFCANAAASLCAYLIYEHNDLNIKDKTHFILEVSGSDRLIDCEAQKYKDGYRVQITMPLPLQIFENNLIFKGRYVEFCIVESYDTCHAVIQDEEQSEWSKELAHHILHNEMQNRCSVKGATLFSKKNQRIEPLIYVEETKTEIWENSCGAASAAVVACMAYKQKREISLDIIQPSGDYIQACAICLDDAISRITIEETVYLSSVGIAFV